MQLTTILKCSTLRFADIINLAGDLTTITVHGADGHTHTVSITILRAMENSRLFIPSNYF